MHLKFSYDEHARTCEPDDLMGQSKRTQNGKPISDSQVALIIDAIKSGLALKSDDILLDIACGNGSLSHKLFPSCSAYFGVDISEYLVSVAKREFEQEPKFLFEHCSGLDFLQQAAKPEQYTKVLCYAACQYFSDHELESLLAIIHQRFLNVTHVFVGNIPDRELAHAFYKTHAPTQEELNDTQTAIGRWRTKEQISAIASQAGWKVQFSKMPDEFYASTYRFDVTLTHAE